MLIGRFMKIIGFRMKWEVLESYCFVVLNVSLGFDVKIGCNGYFLNYLHLFDKLKILLQITAYLWILASLICILFLKK